MRDRHLNKIVEYPEPTIPADEAWKEMNALLNKLPPGSIVNKFNRINYIILSFFFLLAILILHKTTRVVFDNNQPHPSAKKPMVLSYPSQNRQSIKIVKGGESKTISIKANPLPSKSNEILFHENESNKPTDLVLKETKSITDQVSKSSTVKNNTESHYKIMDNPSAHINFFPHSKKDPKSKKEDTYSLSRRNFNATIRAYNFDHINNDLAKVIIVKMFSPVNNDLDSSGTTHRINSLLPSLKTPESKNPLIYPGKKNKVQNNFHFGIQESSPLKWDHISLINKKNKKNVSNLLLPQLYFQYNLKHNYIQLTYALTTQKSFSNALIKEVRSVRFPDSTSFSIDTFLHKSVYGSVNFKVAHKFNNHIIIALALDWSNFHWALLESKTSNLSTSTITHDSLFVAAQNSTIGGQFKRNTFSFNPSISYFLAKFTLGLDYMFGLSPVAPITDKKLKANYFSLTLKYQVK